MHYRCVLLMLLFGTTESDAGAGRSSMGGTASGGEPPEQLDLREVMLDQRLGRRVAAGGERVEEWIGRLVNCSCEAFENVPPKGAARLVAVHRAGAGRDGGGGGGVRFDSLRRLPMTYGPLSRGRCRGGDGRGSGR